MTRYRITITVEAKTPGQALERFLADDDGKYYVDILDANIEEVPRPTPPTAYKQTTPTGTTYNLSPSGRIICSTPHEPWARPEDAA